MSATKKRSARRADVNNITDMRVGLYVHVSVADVQDKAKQRKQDVKQLVTKQTEDQKQVGIEIVSQRNAIVADIYPDPDYSASRYATKQRPEFARLLGDIRAGKLDVIWFWESSRATREIEVFAQLRNLCREMGVLWMVRDRVYDPDAYMDMVTPAIMSVIDEISSEQTSERVRRGRKFAATNGRPASVAYGYKRIYDSTTGKSIRDEPDTFDGNGRAIDDSPAYIVRELYDRVIRGESIHSIQRDLHERGIRSQRGNEFSRPALRTILTNDTYIGKRRHQGVPLPGVDMSKFRPSLIAEEVFWQVQAILTDTSRLTWRPAKSELLLSTVLRCNECGGKMRGRWERRVRAGRPIEVGHYVCEEHGCAAIRASRIDPLVEDVIVTWLADPIVVECLTSGDDSATSKAARADADEARVRLQEWQTLAEKGEIDAKGYALATGALRKRIEEAEQLMSTTTTPPVLVGMLGDHAADTWISLPVDVKRQLVRVVADIRVKPVPPELYKKTVPVAARISWRWLIGPEQNEPIEFPHLEQVKLPLTRQSHCIHGHEFDEQNTRYTKQGFRQCRRCFADRARARRSRERAAATR